MKEAFDWPAMRLARSSLATISISSQTPIIFSLGLCLPGAMVVSFGDREIITGVNALVKYIFAFLLHFYCILRKRG